MFVIEKSLLLTDSEHKALYTDADGKSVSKGQSLFSKWFKYGITIQSECMDHIIIPQLFVLLVNDSLSLRFSSLGFSVFS